VALLGIERSHVAWLRLMERGLLTGAEVEPFIADLVWLGEELEVVFPNARRSTSQTRWPGCGRLKAGDADMASRSAA
jgi:hypothetical protein